MVVVLVQRVVAPLQVMVVDCDFDLEEEEEA